MPVKWKRAYARQTRVANGNVGPCQMTGCAQRATVIVEWEIVGYGTTRSWYCDEHAPIPGEPTR